MECSPTKLWHLTRI